MLSRNNVIIIRDLTITTTRIQIQIQYKYKYYYERTIYNLMLYLHCLGIIYVVRSYLNKTWQYANVNFAITAYCSLHSNNVNAVSYHQRGAGVSTFTKRMRMWQVHSNVARSGRSSDWTGRHLHQLIRKNKKMVHVIPSLSSFIFTSLLCRLARATLSHHIISSGGFHRIHIHCCQEGKCILYMLERLRPMFYIGHNKANQHFWFFFCRIHHFLLWLQLNRRSYCITIRDYKLSYLQFAFAIGSGI